MKKFKILFLAISSALAFSLSANAMDKRNVEKQYVSDTKNQKKKYSTNLNEIEEESLENEKEKNFLNLKNQQKKNLKEREKFLNEQEEKLKNLLEHAKKNIEKITEYSIDKTEYEDKFLTFEATFYYLFESLIVYFDINEKRELSDQEGFLKSLFEIASDYYQAFENENILSNFNIKEIDTSILLNSIDYQKILTKGSNIEKISEKITLSKSNNMVLSNEDKSLVLLFINTQKVLSKLKEIKKNILNQEKTSLKKQKENVLNQEEYIEDTFKQISENLNACKSALVNFPNNSIDNKRKSIFYLIKAFSTKALFYINTTSHLRQFYKIKKTYKNILNDMEKLYKKIHMPKNGLLEGYCFQSQIEDKIPLKEEEIIDYSNKLKMLFIQIDRINDPCLINQILTLWSYLLRLFKNEGLDYNYGIDQLKIYVKNKIHEFDKLFTTDDYESSVIINRYDDDDDDDDDDE